MQLFVTQKFQLIVALVLVLVSVFYCPRAIAEPIPEQAEEKLEEILLRDEFQPRGSRLSFWDEIKEEVFGKAARAFKKWWDRLPLDKIGIDPDSKFIKVMEAIGGVLLKIAELLILILAQAWYILGLLVLIGIVYLVYKLYLAQFTNEESSLDVKPLTDLGNLTYADVKSLSGDVERLAGLRRLLRQEFAYKNKLPVSITDRAVMRELPDTSNLKPLFMQVSREFEKVVYAGYEIESSEVHSAMGKYEEIFEVRR